MLFASALSAARRFVQSHRPLITFGLALTLFPSAMVDRANAEELSDAQSWLPSTTVMYAEVTEPGELLDLLLEHPLREKIEALDGVVEAKKQKPYRDLQTAVNLIESQLDMSWPEILKGFSGDGLVAAVDAPSQAVVIGFYSDGSDTPDRFLKSLIDLSALDATANGRAAPVREAQYRDIKVWRAGEARFTRIGRWTWITNKDDFGKAMIDAYLDGRDDSLATSSNFQAALESRSEADAWAYVDMVAIRSLPNYEEIPEKTDNPAAELLIGGFLDLAKNIPYLSMSIDLESDRIAASVQSPMNEEWRSEPREYWWGSDESGAAPQSLKLDNVITQVQFYRDISEMWLRAGDLFVDQTIDQLDQADSTLSTLFSGADFAEDILGAFAPEGHLVISRQEFPDAEYAPDIKLPSFAVVFSLDDPKKMQPQLKRIFQSLIGFLNVAGAMNGQPQLDLNMESEDGVQITSGSYVVPDEDDRVTEGLPIQYNFSPSIGFSENRCVISSTLDLAKQILSAETEVTTGSPDSPEQIVNTQGQVSFEPLQQVLSDNQSQLIAQTILDDGKSPEEAERDIETLIDLIGWIDSLEFDFSHDESTAEVRMELKLDSTQGE